MRWVALALTVVVSAGCFGGGHTAASTKPRDAFSVVVRGVSRGTVHRYMLTCRPARGSMPHPAVACAAVADYVARGRPTANCSTPLDSAGPAASIRGRFDDRRFTLDLGMFSWCGVPPAAMRDFWALSTFPCATVLERIQRFTPRQFARLSGCAGDRPIGDNAPLRESIHG